MSYPGIVTILRLLMGAPCCLGAAKIVGHPLYINRSVINSLNRLFGDAKGLLALTPQVLSV